MLALGIYSEILAETLSAREMKNIFLFCALSVIGSSCILSCLANAGKQSWKNFRMVKKFLKRLPNLQQTLRL